MTAHFTTMTDNKQGVSTLERDEFTKLLGTLSGVDVANFELAVFKRGELLFENDMTDEEVDNLPVEDLTPVHVAYFDTFEEAEAGHRAVVDAINNGTLKYSGVPEARR